MRARHGRTAFVFDLDGTLVDSAPDIGDALGEVLRGDGRAPLSLDEVRGLIGDGVAVLLQRAWSLTGSPIDPAELDDRVDRFLSSYAAGGHARTRPGMLAHGHPPRPPVRGALPKEPVVKTRRGLTSRTASAK